MNTNTGVSASSEEAVDKALADAGITSEAQTLRESPGDVIERASKTWDEGVAERADREASKLEKYLNEKEARDPAYKAERDAARQKTETYDKLEVDLKSAAGEASAWEETTALRRELEELYPGKSPRDIVDTWLKLNQSYVADPAGTAEWHVQQLLAEAPVIAQARKILPQDQSFDSAWTRAGRSIDERNAWKAIMDYAQQSGIGVREGLAQIIHHTKEGRRDPVYATARMAAQAGLPVTPTSQEAASFNTEREAEHRELTNTMQDEIEAAASGGRLPGFDRQELQDAMADIIESDGFVGTGNLQHNLWNAYHVAMHVENERLREAQAGDTSRKANLSVTGGTPAGAGSRPVPASAGEAIDNALVDFGTRR